MLRFCIASSGRKMVHSLDNLSLSRECSSRIHYEKYAVYISVFIVLFLVFRALFDCFGSFDRELC